MSNKKQNELPATAATLEEIEQFADREDLTADDVPQLVQYRDFLDRMITKIKSKSAG